MGKKDLYISLSSYAISIFTEEGKMKLQQESAVVAVGDVVVTGEFIVNSGNSGFTDNNPHLHFELYNQFPYHWLDDSTPFTFRNVVGPLDERGGIQYCVTYTALPFKI